jgi:curli biogenesis system outer membrane secretion channel CsgG
MKKMAVLVLLLLMSPFAHPAYADEEGGRVRKETAAKVGELLGVQAFIQGAVTEFDETTVGGKSSGKLSFIAGKANVTTATVGIDMRMYDTTTGVILQSHKAEKKARKVGVGLSDWRSGLAGNWKSKSAIGEAARDAMKELVETIVEKMGKIPWEGRVVKVEGGTVVLNAGREIGMEAGAVLEVLHPGEDLIDPETGMSLGSEAEKVGEIKIVNVQDKFSKCEKVSGGGFERGDIVRLSDGSKKTYQPKKRIAVAAMSVKVPAPAWDLGAGLGDMLITELVATEKFIVLERASLDRILAEQDLGGVRKPQPAEPPRASAAPMRGGGAFPAAIIPQMARAVFDMAFYAGGFWLGSKDYEPGEWTKWYSESDAYLAEKAFLKREGNGNEWWRVTMLNDDGDMIIFEGLFAPQRSRLLRLRAKFPDQEPGEVPVTDEQFYMPPGKLTKESREAAIVGSETIKVKAGRYKTSKAAFSVMGAGTSEWWLNESVPGGVAKYLIRASRKNKVVYVLELADMGSDATTILNSY